MKSKKAFTLIELLVVVAIIALLIAILLPSLARAREMARRSMCSSNQHQIGVAMLQYAQSNRESFPRVRDITGTQSIVATDSGAMRNLAANAEDNAFATAQFNPASSTPTISMNLWLLCRQDYQPIDTKVFICPSVKRKYNVPDPMTENNNDRRGPKYFSDFYSTGVGGALFTYSFHTPWSKNWNASSPKPGFIISGDENNGVNPQAVSGAPANSSASSTAGEDATRTNSENHEREGQNIMAIDMSVKFVKRAHSGLSDDNIYTSYVASNVVTAATLTGVTPGTAAGAKRVKPSGDSFDTVLAPVSAGALTGWGAAWN